MVAGKRQRGFTLIELSVVIMIVATMAAMSVLAINQAFDRRYSSEADRLLVWLEQLAEYSALQGAAYGVITETSNASQTLA
ncbi:type II secretion system GspH family protein [Porticoccaceae bacterium]|nr:type II secretion system GspH family protein [Porticoccaceae bacterium]